MWLIYCFNNDLDLTLKNKDGDNIFEYIEKMIRIDQIKNNIDNELIRINIITKIKEYQDAPKKLALAKGLHSRLGKDSGMSIIVETELFNRIARNLQLLEYSTKKPEYYSSDDDINWDDESSDDINWDDESSDDDKPLKKQKLNQSGKGKKKKKRQTKKRKPFKKKKCGGGPKKSNYKNKKNKSKFNKNLHII